MPEEDSMRNVYALGAVSFFTDVSSEMVLSLLSVFILGLPGGNRAFLGLIEGTVETVQRALVPGYAGPGLRGTAYGVYYLVVGSAFFVANSVVGALWELYGSTAASLYSVASSTIAIVAMLVFLKKGANRKIEGSA